MTLDLTSEINALAAWVNANVPDYELHSLTSEERAYLRDSLPSEEEVMASWGCFVLQRPPSERIALFSDQVEVLQGLTDDPERWCLQALRLGRARNANE